MNKKSGYALRIVLGGYLTYLGIRILSEMIQQRPSNMTLMSVLAVVFILVGVAYAGNAICKTFEIDIKKQIAKMIAKRKAEQKRKAEEAAAAKEMSQVTESTTTEASEDEKVSDDTMPTMFSEEGRKLILGGVEIPYEKGLLGHSDADVMLHAVMDALLGAAALGDIGLHFPDTDPKYKGASSIKLLEHVGGLLEENGYVIENIDATIIAQRPKMRPHIDQMRENMAKALKIDVDQINVKATTEEGLGFTGSGEGISSQAICAIEKFTNYSSVDVMEKPAGCGGCCAGK